MDTSTLVNIAIGLLLVVLVYRMFAPTKGLSTLSLAQFKENMKDSDKPLLIDVREKHEFDRGHIPGAKNYPLSQLKDKIKDIPQDKKVLLYCQSGMRSKQAGRVLSKHGHRSLMHLRGGISVWDEKTQK